MFLVKNICNFKSNCYQIVTSNFSFATNVYPNVILLNWNRPSPCVFNRVANSHWNCSELFSHNFLPSTMVKIKHLVVNSFTVLGGRQQVSTHIRFLSHLVHTLELFIGFKDGSAETQKMLKNITLLFKIRLRLIKRKIEKKDIFRNVQFFNAIHVSHVSHVIFFAKKYICRIQSNWCKIFFNFK